MRVFSLFILLLLSTSCNFFSKKKTHNQQELDLVVDFTKVDVYPSFKICDTLIDEEKIKCFRTNMYQELTNNLQQVEFTVEEDVNELITVSLLIDKKGNVSLKDIESSEFVENQLPDLEWYIKTSISSLPKLSPAIKRGIPVTTQYKLPIKIKTK